MTYRILCPCGCGEPVIVTSMLSDDTTVAVAPCRMRAADGNVRPLMMKRSYAESAVLPGNWNGSRQTWRRVWLVLKWLVIGFLAGPFGFAFVAAFGGWAVNGTYSVVVLSIWMAVGIWGYRRDNAQLAAQQQYHQPR